VTSKLIYTNSMFYGSEFNRDITEWNVSDIADMSDMFGNSPIKADSWDEYLTYMIPMKRMGIFMEILEL